MESNWEQKSLENLEKKPIDIPKTNFPLINKVLRLRKVPLNELSVEDIRLMIGQNEGLIYLIPLAIQVLNDNLFAEGDFYAGDLLQNVLSRPPLFWKEHRELWENIHDLIKDRIDEIAGHNISVKLFYDNGI